MRMLILLGGGCLIAAATMTGPAVAKNKQATTCGAEYYSHLVGEDVSETQQISQTFRVVPDGSTAAASDAKRLTVVYDKNSHRIVSINCG